MGSIAELLCPSVSYSSGKDLSSPLAASLTPASVRDALPHTLQQSVPKFQLFKQIKIHFFFFSPHPLLIEDAFVLPESNVKWTAS